MTSTDGFEAIRGARPTRPFYLVIDRPLASLSPRVQTLLRTASTGGIMVLGWDGSTNPCTLPLDSFCTLNGIDPRQAAFIGAATPSKKVAFGTTYLAETESDLIDTLMDMLS